jgi:hypothetical protein
MTVPSCQGTFMKLSDCSVPRVQSPIARRERRVESVWEQSWNHLKRRTYPWPGSQPGNSRHIDRRTEAGRRVHAKLPPTHEIRAGVLRLTTVEIVGPRTTLELIHSEDDRQDQGESNDERAIRKECSDARQGRRLCERPGPDYTSLWHGHFRRTIFFTAENVAPCSDVAVNR